MRSLIHGRRRAEEGWALLNGVLGVAVDSVGDAPPDPTDLEFDLGSRRRCPEVDLVESTRMRVIVSSSGQLNSDSSQTVCAGPSAVGVSFLEDEVDVAVLLFDFFRRSGKYCSLTYCQNSLNSCGKIARQ